MSTNHTTNYELCQWEATDQVQRTDFNQDNAKIDTALAEHEAAIAGKAPMTVLYQVTITENTYTLPLDTNTMGWGNYSLVLLTYAPGGGSSGTLALEDGHPLVSGGYRVDLGFSDHNRQEGALAAGSAAYPMSVLFFPGRNPEAPINALFFARQNFGFGYCGNSYTNEYGLALTAAPIAPGSQIRVVGFL